MARQAPPDPSQLALFDDPVLWWPGQPPERRRPPERRPPRPPAPAPGEQLALFHLPRVERRKRKRRVKVIPHKQTYLDLADALGLPRLQALVNLPATYFMVDAFPLRDGLGVETLLDARYRVEAQIDDAFDEVVTLSPEEVRRAPLVVWAGRRLGHGGARSPHGEALILALSGTDHRAWDPFVLRLRGLPGYLGHEEGPSPLEDGDELLSLYDGDVLHPLLPREAQPMSLERLLAG